MYSLWAALWFAFPGKSETLSKKFRHYFERLAITSCGKTRSISPRRHHSLLTFPSFNTKWHSGKWPVMFVSYPENEWDYPSLASNILYMPVAPVLYLLLPERCRSHIGLMLHSAGRWHYHGRLMQMHTRIRRLSAGARLPTHFQKVIKERKGQKKENLITLNVDVNELLPVVTGFPVHC